MCGSCTRNDKLDKLQSEKQKRRVIVHEVNLCMCQVCACGGGAESGVSVLKEKHTSALHASYSHNKESGWWPPRGRVPISTKARINKQQLLGPVTERPVCFGGQRRAAGQCQRI